MARTKLTAGRIASFILPDGSKQAFLWDSEVSQLAVRATVGAKSYIFQSRLDGRSLRLTIGNITDWGIDAARKESRRLQTLIDKGIDPRKEKAEQRKANAADRKAVLRSAVTVAEAWQSYIDDRKSKWSFRHQTDHEDMADAGGRKVKRGTGITSPGVLAPLMPLKLAQLDAAKVKKWLAAESVRRPTRAKLAFNLLRAFINWCNNTDDYQGIVLPDTVNNRIAKDILPKATAKTDCLQREQLKGWFDAVRSISSPTVSAYLQILLLTGARRDSLAALKWSDVDFRWNTLTVRDKEESKGGADGTRDIPLTPYVANLLADLKRRNETPPAKYRILHGKKIDNDLANWQASVWVFPSKSASSGRLQDPTRQHYKACTNAGISGLTLHGLRRSFATLTEWIECPTGIVAQIMGHKPSATAERHYKVRPIDLLRMWHTKIETWILNQAKVSLKKKAQNKLQSA